MPYTIKFSKRKARRMFTLPGKSADSSIYIGKDDPDNLKTRRVKTHAKVISHETLHYVIHKTAKESGMSNKSAGNATFGLDLVASTGSSRSTRPEIDLSPSRQTDRYIETQPKRYEKRRAQNDESHKAMAIDDINYHAEKNAIRKARRCSTCDNTSSHSHGKHGCCGSNKCHYNITVGHILYGENRYKKY